MPKVPIKRGKDIERMREAGHIASEILQLTAHQIEDGKTTQDIEDYAVEMMQERGCKSVFYKYRGFPGQICISLNDEVVHGIASPNRKIKDGDVVKIDIGIMKNGWIGDNATTVPVGDIDPATRHLLWATEESLHVAIDYCREGYRLGDVCSSVDRTVRHYHYTVVEEFVGHGVGRKLHEPPQIPNYGIPEHNPKLKAGMVFAIEPMVNLGGRQIEILADNWTAKTMDRKPSAHFEHSVLVTDDEPEILTPRPRLMEDQPPIPARSVPKIIQGPVSA